MKQLQKRRFLVFVVVLALMGLAVETLAGCTVNSSTRIGFVENHGLGHWQCTYAHFNGRDATTFRAKAGEEVSVDYHARVEQGSLELSVWDASGHQLQSAYLEENDSGTLSFSAEQTGRYTIVASGAKTKGGFDLTW